MCPYVFITTEVASNLACYIHTHCTHTRTHCTHTRAHTHAHTVRTHAHTHTHTHTHTVRTHAHTHTHTHTHTRAHTQTAWWELDVRIPTSTSYPIALGSNCIHTHHMPKVSCFAIAFCCTVDVYHVNRIIMKGTDKPAGHLQVMSLIF